MFGMGFSEILIIAAIALIFLGPEKFPEFAKLAIRTVRDLRSYMDDIKTEISKEVRPVSSELKQLSKYDPEKYIDALSPKKSEEKKAESAAATTPEAKPAEGVETYNSGDFGESDSAESEPSPARTEAEELTPESAPADSVPGDDRREEKFPD